MHIHRGLNLLALTLGPTTRYHHPQCRAFSGGQLWLKLFPGIAARWGSFSGAFYLPGVREFSLCCGCIDASRPVLTRAIERGENLHLLPGGRGVGRRT